MLTQNEFKQIKVALEAMGGHNIEGMHIPTQNVLALLATYVEQEEKMKRPYYFAYHDDVDTEFGQDVFLLVEKAWWDKAGCLVDQHIGENVILPEEMHEIQESVFDFIEPEIRMHNPATLYPEFAKRIKEKLIALGHVEKREILP